MYIANRRGFELAISTLVIIVLGIFVLIGLVYAITGGLETFKSSSEPFLDTTQASSVKQACQLACQNQDKLTFCCNEYEASNQQLKCSDSRLEIDCEFSCENYECSPSELTGQECESRGGIVLADIGDGAVSRGECPSGKEFLASVKLGTEGGICCR